MNIIEEKKKISVGCCCYNEGKNVIDTYEAVTKLMSKMEKYDYEIVFEDNASTDDTKEYLRKIASEDSHVKVIFNAANFGINRSGTNLMNNLSGDIYMSIPCDLQEPIENYKKYIEEWEKGYDVVFGQKVKSKESKLKYICRTIYYKIINLFSDYEELIHCDGYGIIDMKVLKAFLVSRTQDPDILLRHWVVRNGVKIKLIPYTQRERTVGKSSFNIKRSIDFSISSLCNTSTKIIRFFTLTGLLFSTINLLVVIGLIIYKVINWSTVYITTQLIVCSLFLFIGIILFGIGILGEYLNIILKRVSKRVLVVESERLNFDKE